MTILEELLEGTAQQLAHNVRKQINAAGHVRTGRLLLSVNTELVKNGNTWTVEGSMEAYGVNLDRRKPFLSLAYPNEAQLAQELEQQLANYIQSQL
ncbi:MAG: hypothetical protein SFW35_00855 [Chitinophagales bacterium]|nr:hypothetical protein [Chitinophagales bacterium]